MSRNNDHFGGAATFVKRAIGGVGYLGEYRNCQPVPPISEYEAYCATLDSRAQKHFNRFRHRRVTILVRGGETFNEACHLAGFRSTGAVRAVRAKMPDHLK